MHDTTHRAPPCTSKYLSFLMSQFQGTTVSLIPLATKERIMLYLIPQSTAKMCTSPFPKVRGTLDKCISEAGHDCLMGPLDVSSSFQKHGGVTKVG
jgi:hypothetical protein